MAALGKSYAMQHVVVNGQTRYVSAKTAWWHGRTSSSRPRLFCVHNVALVHKCRSCGEAGP